MGIQPTILARKHKRIKTKVNYVHFYKYLHLPFWVSQFGLWRVFFWCLFCIGIPPRLPSVLKSQQCHLRQNLPSTACQFHVGCFILWRRTTSPQYAFHTYCIYFNQVFLGIVAGPDYGYRRYFFYFISHPGHTSHLMACGGCLRNEHMPKCNITKIPNPPCASLIKHLSKTSAWVECGVSQVMWVT